MTEFTVQKFSTRHGDPVKRILCLTETTILERDPQTYSVRRKGNSAATIIFELTLSCRSGMHSQAIGRHLRLSS